MRASNHPRQGSPRRRTKAALKAAKARGVRLGRHGAEVLAPQYREEARQRAKQLEPIMTELRSEGFSLAEVPLVYLLSAFWPKKVVLETYLNIAPWGEGIAGAEAASQGHFGKSAGALTPWARVVRAKF